MFFIKNKREEFDQLTWRRVEKRLRQNNITSHAWESKTYKTYNDGQTKT